MNGSAGLYIAAVANAGFTNCCINSVSTLFTHFQAHHHNTSSLLLLSASVIHTQCRCLPGLLRLACALGRRRAYWLLATQHCSRGS